MHKDYQCLVSFFVVFDTVGAANDVDILSLLRIVIILILSFSEFMILSWFGIECIMQLGLEMLDVF